MSPVQANTNDELSGLGDVVVDMLDVADSVLETVIKDIKINNSQIYFKVSGWLDRNIVSKVLFQLFDVQADTNLKIQSISSDKAIVTLDGAKMYHYEAFSSPQLRLLAQLASMSVLENWKIEFISSEEDFKQLHGAVSINPDKMLKTVAEYAKTIADSNLSETAYPAVLRGTGIEEEFVKELQYDGPVNMNSFLYLWKATYGLTLSMPTIEYVTDKLRASAKNIPEYAFYADFFKKLHTLPETTPLLALEDIWAYSPGAIYEYFAKVKSELTKQDKDAALRQIILALYAYSSNLRETLVRYPDSDKQLNDEIVNLIRLETPWRVSKEKIREALTSVLDGVAELTKFIRTNISTLDSSVSIEESQINPFDILWLLQNTLSIVASEDYSVLSDMVTPYNELVRQLVTGAKISVDPLKELTTELKRTFIDINVFFNRYATAVEEASALVSEGLGVDAVQLQLVGDSVDSLVELTNKLSTGNSELDEQVMPVVRSVLLGRPIDDTQKSIVAALLSEEGTREAT